MKTWVELYRGHTNMRASGDKAVTTIRQVLRALGEHKNSVFQAKVEARFNHKNSSQRDVQTFQLGDDKGEPIQLKKLCQTDQDHVFLAEGRLTILLLLNRARGHLHQLTVMVEGKRSDGTDWTVAVHLPDDRGEKEGDRQGLGACGHAALHCHVGPTLESKPNVRVPLPLLAPSEIVEWVMSQVVPTIAFEAAPWPSVMDELKPRSAKS